MVRIASIGYGDIAQSVRFPELQSVSDRAEFVAIAGRNGARMAECARRFGVERTYTDVDALLAAPDIDAVLILTPPESHGELALKAVAAGKHVLLEKPMVRSIAEAKRILAAVEANPVVFYALPDVGSATHDLLRELVASGIIGEVTSIECHKGHRGPTHADWFYRKEVAGGGVLFDLGIYALSEVAYVFGPATRLSALCTTHFAERTMDDGHTVRPDVEDSALVNLELKSGVAVAVNANWNGYLTHRQTRSRLTAIGRGGMLHFGVPGGGIYVHRNDEAYERFFPGGERVQFDGYECRKYVPAPSAGRAQGMMGRFVERIAAGDTDVLPLKRQVHVMEQMLAAYQCGGPHDVQRLTTDF